MEGSCTQASTSIDPLLVMVKVPYSAEKKTGFTQQREKKRVSHSTRLVMYLCVFLFALELQLDVEQQNLGIYVALGLHLKAGVAKGLLERNAVDEEAVAQVASRNLLDAFGKCG